MTAATVGPPGAAYIGSWHAWWPGDPLPDLPPLTGFAAAPAGDDRALAALAGVEMAAVTTWRAAGNQPYLAWLDDRPVACGWSARGVVEIGEIGLTFTLPPGDRYLWGFVTAPPWRGRGLYPRLLQAILRHEGLTCFRYWIGHEPGNEASVKGMASAGFRRIGDVYRQPGGGFLLAPAGPLERAGRGAALLGAALSR